MKSNNPLYLNQTCAITSKDFARCWIPSHFPKPCNVVLSPSRCTWMDQRGPVSWKCRKLGEDLPFSLLLVGGGAVPSELLYCSREHQPQTPELLPRASPTPPHLSSCSRLFLLHSPPPQKQFRLTAQFPVCSYQFILSTLTLGRSEVYFLYFCISPCSGPLSDVTHNINFYKTAGAVVHVKYFLSVTWQT